MSIEEIIQLIQAVSENKLTSFELEEGNMKLSLKCKKEQPRLSRWQQLPWTRQLSRC